MLHALLLSAALVFTQADADFAFACASNFVEKCTPRDAGTVSGHLAANWILDTTSTTGADVRRDRFTAEARTREGKVVTRSFTNLYALFNRKPDAPWIVIVSHYDTKPGVNCPGANDGASTTGLLIALASVLENNASEANANVLLAWLDGEECVKAYDETDGFWGSKRAVAEMQRHQRNIRAVLCLDMLGDKDLHISIPANGDSRLTAIAKVAAQRARVPIQSIAALIKDDHVAFMDAGYPAIDLIDFDYGSTPGKNDWWHTAQDTTDKISPSSLLKAGRLVTTLVNLLSK